MHADVPSLSVVGVLVVDRDIHHAISGGGECGGVFDIKGFGPIAQFEFEGVRREPERRKEETRMISWNGET